MRFLHTVKHFWIGSYRIVSYRDILCNIVSYRIVSLMAVSCHHYMLDYQFMGLEPEGNEIQCDTQYAEICIVFEVLLFQLLCVSDLEF